MKTVAITGATGFVGSHLVRHFSQKPGWRVIALGRGERPPVALAARAEYRSADLCAPIAPVACDACIHAAALADDRAPLAHLRLANVDGTRHLLDALRGCGAFVHISSSSVYDLRSEVHFEDEPADTRLLSNYGLTKREAESVVENHPARPNRAIVLRPRAIYGPGDRVLLPRILSLWKNGRATVPGDLRVMSSMTHIGNLVAVAEAGLAAQSVGFQCFNVADGQPYLLRDVFEGLLEGAFGRKPSFRELPVAPLFWLAKLCEKTGLPSRLTSQSLGYLTNPAILDCSKIGRELGVSFPKNFQDGLPEILDWVKKVGIEKARSGGHELPWLV